MELLHEDPIAKEEKLERLHHGAEICRDLAETALTVEARKIFLDMASDYEGSAAALANGEKVAG